MPGDLGRRAVLRKRAMTSRRSRLRSFARWLILAGGALAVMVGGIWIWLGTALPKVSGTIELSGLQAPVEIDRDKDGIPPSRLNAPVGFPAGTL